MTRLAYYVYYCVARAADAKAQDAVRSAQSDIAVATGAEARLLMRHAEPDLWMEVYEDVADAAGFERALAVAVEHHQLLSLLRDGAHRKIEIFVES